MTDGQGLDLVPVYQIFGGLHRYANTHFRGTFVLNIGKGTLKINNQPGNILMSHHRFEGTNTSEP